ncbi:hypothetical protein AAG906_019386 [Vitis piasezkii]
MISRIVVLSGFHHRPYLVRLVRITQFLFQRRTFRFKLTAKEVMKITYEEKHSLRCFPLMGSNTKSLSLMHLAMAHTSHLALAIQESKSLPSVGYSRKSYLQTTSQRLARGKLVHLHGRRSLALPSVGPSDLKAF